MDPKKDQRDAVGAFVAIAILLVCAAILLVWIVPLVGNIISGHIEPGLGLRDAAIIAFGISLLVIITMAIFSGDGLIGEIQFVIPGFFLFYVVLWIQLAWFF